MKLKTLKDLRRPVYGCNSGEVLDIVKQEAIKWVKEDIEEFGIDLGLYDNRESNLLRKWMKRLNITEEDLK